MSLTKSDLEAISNVKYPDTDSNGRKRTPYAVYCNGNEWGYKYQTCPLIDGTFAEFTNKLKGSGS